MTITATPNSSKPNLFTWATSELSQDAVLAWLASWADPACADAGRPQVHAAGREFVHGLLRTVGAEIPNLDSVRVVRQVRRVDLVIVVNERIAVLIEDKTYTRDHGGQLSRYLDDDKLADAIDVNAPEFYGVYLKLGNECARELSDPRWKIVHRKALIEMLPTVPSGSDILDDFVNHVHGIEARTNAFVNESAMGDQLAQQGLHDWLWNELGEGSGGWNYVPKGDFNGLWWGFAPVENMTAKAYLQLHGRDELYLRLYGDEGTKVTVQHRDEIQRRLQNAPSEIVVERQRFRGGYSSAVARLKLEDRPWIVYDNGTLDRERTLENLRLAMTLIDHACAE